MTRPRGTVTPVDALGASIADTKARASALEVVAHRHPGDLGGIILCTSTTRPAQYDGAVIYETDTNRVLISDGTTWRLWGGVVSYTSATRPATPDDGTVIWETDTDQLWAYNGTAWVRLYPPAPSVITAIACRQYASTVRAIANNSLVATIPFNLAGDNLWDTDNFHNPAVNPSRITVPAGLSGYYQIDAGVVFAANAAGIRSLNVLINGATSIGAHTTNSVGAVFGVSLTVSAHYYLSAGQYVEAFVYQNTGAALNVGGGTNTYLGLTWIGS